MGYELPMKEAIEHLMKNYDDDGNNIMKQKGNTTSNSDCDAVYDYDTPYLPESTTSYFKMNFSMQLQFE
jgi:hypothetical protein